MREIKFRGKIKNRYVDKWIYGYLVNECYINEKNRIGYTAIDKETVGQYTGLKNKNGVEIYEGDIVKLGTYTKGVVEYSNKYAQFIITNTNTIAYECEPLGDYEKIEVIGNIYDNPELLKAGD